MADLRCPHCSEFQFLVWGRPELSDGRGAVYNTIATVRGTEKPNKYVMLSAHLDSWDAGTGATDNGTGAIIMLEAMRILRAVYPHPKRTIIAGHWSGEEQGDIGSSAWAADHPEIVNSLQALFNQDNGTGNIDRVVTNGFTGAVPSQMDVDHARRGHQRDRHGAPRLPQDEGARSGARSPRASVQPRVAEL